MGLGCTFRSTLCELASEGILARSCFVKNLTLCSVFIFIFYSIFVYLTVRASLPYYRCSHIVVQVWYTYPTMPKNNTKYVDGFVLVVPQAKTAVYKKMASSAAKVWMKHGALDYKECMGDDMSPSMGEVIALTFPKLTQLKKGETVWFSYITYKSRAHRDQVNKKVMAEMSKYAEKHKNLQMPFDIKRMAYGGFKVIVSS